MNKKFKYEDNTWYQINVDDTIEIANEKHTQELSELYNELTEDLLTSTDPITGEVSENDFRLIDLNVGYDTDYYGVLNCFVNGVQNQVRF